MNARALLKVRLGKSSPLQVSCACCQSRNLSSSRIRKEEEKQITGKSALDDLFDAPDAYDRHEVIPRSKHSANRSGFPSQKISRTVLGSGLSNDSTSQLNQEWEGTSKRRSDYQSSSNSAPLRGPQDAGARKKYDGTMTPNENKLFAGIFNSFFNDAAGSKLTKPVEDDGAFGSSFSNNKVGTLQEFQQRNRLEMKNRAARKRYLSSVLSERISFSELSEDEIERKIDEAREEIVACNNVSEIWQWAGRNVWGVNMDVSSSGNEKTEADSIKENLDIEETHTTKDSPRFGMATPYYSPVLLLLLTNLRERFTSPQSALSVLRIAKNLGPDSFVLGCSPQLYAEAIRTQWMVLRDLQGTRDILREAKDTGILGRGSTMQSLAERPDPKDEESRFREITSKVKNDVRFQVIEGSKRLPEGVTPLIYEHQLELVAEMDQILGSQSRPASRRPKLY